jgi:hypothetical protein
MMPWLYEYVVYRPNAVHDETFILERDDSAVTWPPPTLLDSKDKMVNLYNNIS